MIILEWFGALIGLLLGGIVLAGLAAFIVLLAPIIALLIIADK